MLVRDTVDAAVNRLFDYLVPDHLCARMVPGTRVRVPFGPRTVTGYVVEVDLAERSDPADQPDLLGSVTPARALKSILSIVGEHPFLTEPLLKLLQWLADYYCSSLESAIRSAVADVQRAGCVVERLQIEHDSPLLSSGAG